MINIKDLDDDSDDIEVEIISPGSSRPRPAAIEISDLDDDGVLDISPTRYGVGETQPQAPAIALSDLEASDDEDVSEEVLAMFSREEEEPTALITIEDLDGIDEEEFMLEEVPNNSMTRLAVNEPVEQSIALMTGIVALTTKTLSAIDTQQREYAAQDNSFLGELFASMDLTFLPAERFSAILADMGTNMPKKELIEKFLSKYTLNARDRSKFITVVDKMYEQYSEYLRRAEIERKIARGYGSNLATDIIQQIQADADLISKSHQEGNIAIVGKIMLSSEDLDFECGACKQWTTTKESFFTVMAHENIGQRGRNLQVFAKGLVCSHCGKLNILAGAEHLKVADALSRSYDELLSKWKSKSTPKLTKGTNIVVYKPSKEFYINCYPQLFSEKIVNEPVEKEDKTKDLKAISDIMKRWYTETVKVIDKLNVANGSKDTGVKVKGSTLVLKEANYFDIKLVAKMVCSMFKEDFDRLFENAKNTVLLTLSNSYVAELLLSNKFLISNKVAVYPENYLKADLKDEALVYKNLCNTLGVDYNIYEEKGRDAVNEKLREQISKLKSSVIRIQDLQNEVLENLEWMIPYFGYMDITSVRESSLKDVEMFLSVEGFAKWLDKVAVMMVVNHIAPKFKDYWRTIKLGHYSNSSLFYENSKKSTMELVTTMANNYDDYLSMYRPAAKLSRLVPRFLSVYPIGDTSLASIRSLKEGIDSDDLYRVYMSILELKDTSLVKNCPDQRLANLITEVYPEAKHFIETHGKTAFDYYKYYYSDQFTDEEIQVVNSHRVFMSKPFYTYLRQEGESFLDFLDRIKTETHSKDKVKEKLEQELDDKFLAVYPVVLGLYTFAKFMNQGLERPQDIVIINDLFLMGTALGFDAYCALLSIMKPPKSMEKELPSVQSIPFEKVLIRHAVEEVVYPSDELTEIQQEMSDSYFSVNQYIQDNQLDYLEILNLMGPEMKELYHEFYSG